MSWLFFIPGMLMLLAALLIGAGDYSQRKAGETPPRVVRTAGALAAAIGVLFVILSFTI